MTSSERSKYSVQRKLKNEASRTHISDKDTCPNQTIHNNLSFEEWVYSVIYAHNQTNAGRNLAHKKKKTNGRCERFHDRELPLPTSFTTWLSPDANLRTTFNKHKSSYIHTQPHTLWETLKPSPPMKHYVQCVPSTLGSALSAQETTWSTGYVCAGVCNGGKTRAVA